MEYPSNIEGTFKLCVLGFTVPVFFRDESFVKVQKRVNICGKTGKIKYTVYVFTIVKCVR